MARERPLARDIVAVLAFKVAALVTLYLLCFGPAHRVHVTPGDMAAMLAGEVPQTHGKY